MALSQCNECSCIGCIQGPCVGHGEGTASQLSWLHPLLLPKSLAYYCFWLSLSWSTEWYRPSHFPAPASGHPAALALAGSGGAGMLGGQAGVGVGKWQRNDQRPESCSLPPSVQLDQRDGVGTPSLPSSTTCRCSSPNQPVWCRRVRAKRAASLPHLLGQGQLLWPPAPLPPQDT